MDEVRKEIAAGEISVIKDDGNIITFKMSCELEKVMIDKLDKYDRFMAKKFKQVRKNIKKKYTE